MRMTKAETYERVWRFWYQRDFYLIDEIYHPEYSNFADTPGITANFEDDKTVVLSPSGSLSFSPCKCISESEGLLRIWA